MFDQETWRAQVAERLAGFARNPRQDVQIAGAGSVLAYLSVRTLEPFLDAFQHYPVAAVLALSEITQGSGADHLVHRASQMRYQVAQIIERELHSRPDLRMAIEQIMVALDVLHIARQRLNSSRDEWLRVTLLKEIEAFDLQEFVHLRRLLHDPGWQSRYDTIRSLRQRNGSYTAADLVLIHDGLGDSASHVRAAAARMLGQFAGTPPVPLVKALTRVALYDCDLETRYAAARTLGSLRDRIASPQMIDHLSTCLMDDDSFVRSAAALVLSQLGDLAGTPAMVERLTALVHDNDPYAREAAARALGRIGSSAATSAVLNALARAIEDPDPNVHEAAVDSLTRLRKTRSTLPLNSAPPEQRSGEPISVD
jgi:HEAT repeat protein